MKKTVLVLGMHRSGTSAMAGVLNKLGCYSGEKDDLFSADANNNSGYFERSDVVSCNEEILSKHFIDEFQESINMSCFETNTSLDNYGWLFGAWSSPFKVAASKDTPQRIYKALDDLKNNAREDALAYVIKDPRISLTYPFWEYALNEKPVIVIMLRHPMHVAESLFKRDGIPIEAGIAIWASYTRSAFEYTKNNPRVIVNYDDLVDNTKTVVNDICLFFKENGINFEAPSSATEFIKSEFRHSNKKMTPNIECEVINLYERIKDNDLEAITLLTPVREKDYSGWEKALFIPALAYKTRMETKLEGTISTMNAKVTRLRNHPITGPVIKMVRWMKKDKTFGDDFLDEKIDYYGQLRPEMLQLIPAEANRILDVGCAHGIFSESIRNRQPAETWGVEIDREASEEASKRLHFVINDNAESALEKLPDNYFDCIIFNDVLEHMVDPYSLVNTIKSKLAPEGVVVASLPNIRFFEVLFFLLFSKRWDYQNCGVLDKTHLRFFTYKNIKELFTSNEYEIREFKGINPTRSVLYNIVNILSFGFMWDSRYTQFACVAQKKKGSNEQ